MPHPAFATGNVAVVTGAAMGIGFAACKRFAELGLNVVMTDVAAADLDQAAKDVAADAPNGADQVMAMPADVSNPGDLIALKEAASGRFGNVSVLMNNAVTRVGGGVGAELADWHRAVDVNLWGPINGVRTFVPDMLTTSTPGLIVNVGSKQGITNPPGNLAYNMTKAAVKTFTEGLQHELRNTEGCQISAHLLVPGWTTTGRKQHQPGAWLPDQVVEFMMAALERGDFYIVCPDDEVTSEMDRQRIAWAASDITENRPPLSRWHPDWTEAFDRYCADN